MSLMSKYLNQSCKVQRVTRDASDKAVLDIYGSPTYDAVISVPCRKEATTAEVLTSTGSLLRSQYVYYVEVPIRSEDRIDDHAILTVKEYIDVSGNIIGYECRT